MPPSKDARLLTATNSRLAKVDLSSLLLRPEAWISLPLEKRAELYSKLPAAPPDGPPHHPDTNPLNTAYKAYIEEALRRWQADLAAGKEGPKWRAEALEAGRMRVRGEFDEFRIAEREAYFGDGKGRRASEQRDEK